MEQANTVISLFSGAMGLDLGLEKADFSIRVAIDYNKAAVATIRGARQKIPVIDRKIETVPTIEILEKARLNVGEATIVTGGPACQTFSTAGRRGSVSDPRGVMFREFLRVVSETQPRFFIMENVKGLLSAAIRHRPLKERGAGYPPLEPDEELGSAFKLILKELKATGYYVLFGLLNAADFGVPQTRERLIILGSRDGEQLNMPEATHSNNPGDSKLPWVTLREGLQGLLDPKPSYNEFSEEVKKYLMLIPEGGNWRSLASEIQEKAIGGAYNSWGGRSGFLRRLSWEKPSPALTTNPNGKATMLCHPTELRPLSVCEYAKLQQFPDNWKFAGSINQRYTQIGNAVPIGLGEAIGKAIRSAMHTDKSQTRLGIVSCASQELLDRICHRPKTIINPIKMRKIKDLNATQEWLNGIQRTRSDILEYIDHENNKVI